MLAYAPRQNAMGLRPATLGLIVAGHAGALALLLTARPDLIPTTPFTTTEVILIEEAKPVPPPPPEPAAPTQPSNSEITIVDPIVPPLPAPGPSVDHLPQPIPQPGPVIGSGPTRTPVSLDPPIVRTGPRFVTDGDAIRPPYPLAKREAGDEATLRLRLSIDERGRVVAVDPVGRADPAFLEAARRHILRVWRYQPAMEGAEAVASTTTITLKFELGNA